MQLNCPDYYYNLLNMEELLTLNVERMVDGILPKLIEDYSQVANRTFTLLFCFPQQPEKQMISVSINLRNKHFKNGFPSTAWDCRICIWNFEKYQIQDNTDFEIEKHMRFFLITDLNDLFQDLVERSRKSDAIQTQ